MANIHYRWFIGTEQEASRCLELFNKAANTTLVDVRSLNGEYGLPVGVGPDMPPNNPGGVAVQSVRDGIETNQYLSSEEKTELLAFIALDKEMPSDWWYPPEEEEDEE